jgi:hypothetical protein
LKSEFESAAAEHEVPKELLMAMGYVNTLWEMPPPEATDYEPGDLHGRGTYGIMQLVRTPWEDTLGVAADLTGLSEERLKSERAANVSGGAALLADIAGEERPPSSTVGTRRWPSTAATTFTPKRSSGFWRTGLPRPSPPGRP